MNKWTYLRMALILFVGISSLFVPLGPQAAPPIEWGALLIIFVGSFVGIVLVLGFQVLNPRSVKTWHRPSWSLNPFSFREPLQFFHVGGYVCLAQGLVTIVRIAVSSVPFYVEALVPLVMAVAIFIGLQLVMVLFASKINHGS
jgi:hypothetical protein